MNFIIMLLACWVVAVPVLRYVLFWISNTRSGDMELVRQGLDGRALPHVLCGLVSAMLSELGVLLMLPLGLIFPARAGRGTPVIFVHGLYHNPTAWLWFRILLGRAGYRNFHAFGYNSFTRPFENAVDDLAEVMENVLRDNPERTVVLVGHSLGGLVCRMAASRPEFSGRVGALVALGSPHGGSVLAALGLGPMARGLYPGKAVIRAVEQCRDMQAPKLAVYSLVDDYVLPLSGLRVGRHDWNEQVCSPVSHVSMLFSQDVAWRVAAFLDRALRGGASDSGLALDGSEQGQGRILLDGSEHE
ncbi:alpha/beta fold hydrolase [Pseudodesulfovibrio senegalensis]|uniref:Alpha/beta fold hydrolase n=2 Tax=Pseudodesulfovibrio senegalensis TaxID=1721087 RepID=A0A6N6N1S2_9BACT|nr:alpha/beta fold hydrolase [Pseudodesulfovibrio senegalensis]